VHHPLAILKNRIVDEREKLSVKRMLSLVNSLVPIFGVRKRDISQALKYGAISPL
jgi:hypothetical protein